LQKALPAIFFLYPRRPFYKQDIGQMFPF
jgi:hypothetical protein